MTASRPAAQKGWVSCFALLRIWVSCFACFASHVLLRMLRTKGNGTRKASLTMMFKLAQAAQKRWRRLNKHELILPLIQGKVFTDGIVQDAA